MKLSSMTPITDFQREIAAAARTCFHNLRSSRPDEHFYAYALYTDSDAMTIVPSANSLEGLQETLRAMNATDDKPWITWGVEEWKYCAWNTDGFNEICRKLRSDPVRSDGTADSNFDSFFFRVCSDMVAALKLLDEEGFFGSGEAREQVVLFASINDDDRSDQFEDESARLLNPDTVYDRFSNRF